MTGRWQRTSATVGRLTSPAYASTATTSAASVVFRATFSEAVTGVGTADFTLTQSGLAGTVASVSAVSTSVYDVTVNGLTGFGMLRLDVASGGLADFATNALETAFISGESYTIDTTAQFPITADFTGDNNTTLTADGWLLAGDATATGDRLRLTRAVNGLAGTAIFNQPVATAVGLNVQFDYEMSGGTGADGLSFFLVDGAQASPTPGSTGPALGYGYSGASPGASGAYFGVGFDLWGNFTNSAAFHDGLGTGEKPNRIALRGPATITSSNNAHDEYDCVIGSAVSFSVAGTRKVNLTISPDGHVTLLVSANGGTSWTTIYDDFDFGASAAFNGYTQPSTLKLGFGASTGGSNNLHAIDNVVVRKPADHTIAFTGTPSGTQNAGATASYTVTVANTGWNDDPAARLVYTVPAGLTDVAWSYAVDGGIPVTGTTSAIDETFSLATSKSAVLVVQGTITTAAAGTTLAHSATITPSNAFGDIAPADNTATTSTVISPIPTVTSTLTASGTYGAAFTYTITGSNTPTSFAATGLPAGLTLNTSTGAITGSPTQTGAFNISLTATNSGGTSTPATLVLTIAKAAATVTLDALAQTYDGTARPATVTTTPSGLTTLVTYDAASTVPTTAGSYAVVATINDANYQGSASGTLVVAQAAQAISFTTPDNQVFGVAPIVLAPTATSGLAVSLAVVSGPASLSGGTLTINGAGAVTVRATQAGNTNFLAASAVEHTFTVAPKPVTVTLSSLAHTYDGSAHPAVVALDPTGVSVAVTYDGSGTAPTAAGSYAVVATVTQAHHTGFASGTLVIAQAAQTLDFTPVGPVTVNTPVTLVATTSASLPVTFSVLSGSATLSGATLTVTGGDEPVVLRAAQGGDANRLPVTADQSITSITKVAQTITFAALADRLATAAPEVLAPTASSSLPVTLTLVSGPATLSGGTLTMTGAGTVVVIATQAGNAFYAAAPTIERSFVSTLETQTITFAALADRLATAGPEWLAPTASSGLPATLTLVDGPALLSGGTLTLNGAAGTVTVRAAQVGNAFFAAAPAVERSFAVAAVGPQVFFGELGGEGGLGSIAATVTQDSTRGTLIGQFTDGDGFVVEFDLTLAGQFSAPARRFSIPTAVADEPGVAAAEATWTFEGTVRNGVVTGTIVELGEPFSAVIDPPAGVTVDLAGYYPSVSLDTAAGSVYTIVGTDGTVYSLVVLPDAVSGGTGSITTAGTLAVVTSAGIAVEATVDPQTTEVIGALAVPGQPVQSFSGLQDVTPRTDRLINLSARARVGGGERVLITGFTIGGSAPKRVLVRAVGPAMSAYLTHTLPNPRLRLYRNADPVLNNDDWGRGGAYQEVAETIFRTGAGSLAAGSLDAAAVATLAPGNYTVIVDDPTGEGVALAEVYDASFAPATEYQRLINISARAWVGTGDDVLIGGFVISGNAPKRLLIRGLGPELQGSGVQQPLSNPRLVLYDQAGVVLAANNNWETPLPANLTQTAATGAEINATSTQVGASALNAGAGDAAVIVTLAPGLYSAHLRDEAGVSGIGLIEIYEVPEE